MIKGELPHLGNQGKPGIGLALLTGGLDVQINLSVIISAGDA
jgi:hypothetical protein